MKRYSAASILRQSTSDILGSLDMRPRSRSTTLRRGQTVEAAWFATGAYLKKALQQYGNTPHRTSHTR